MPEPPTATLLLSCPDRKGLVAAVSDFILRCDGNIIHADQHTDPEEGLFLQRVEFQIENLAFRKQELTEGFRPIAERFGMRWALRFSDEVANVAILVSQQAHCMYDLLSRWQLGELRGRVRLVISNHPDHSEAADHFAVAYHHLPVTPSTKQQQESSVLELLASHGVDLVVLARYMQILSADFVAHYEHSMINIHHSFLPAFKGARPYHQAHDRGVKIIGATAHYVTSELDQGPIIEQNVVRVSHRDNVADLARKGRDLEKVVLARAVRLHLEDRVLVYRNKTVVFD